MDLGVSSVHIGQAVKDLVEFNKDTETVICLIGEAGIGKTQIVKQIAEERKPPEPFVWNGETYDNSVPVVVLPLAQMCPEDIGIPFPTFSRRENIMRQCDLYRELHSTTGKQEYFDKLNEELEKT